MIKPYINTWSYRWEVFIAWWKCLFGKHEWKRIPSVTYVNYFVCSNCLESKHEGL